MTVNQRPLPLLSDVNRMFWTSGADGVLRMQRCADCQRLVHPPALRCPYDHGVPEYVELSGRGQVESWTINEHPWFAGFTPPYVIAFVNPVEDERVRVLTNLINIEPDRITPAMPVRVTFERHADGDDEMFIPLFEPDL